MSDNCTYRRGDTETEVNVAFGKRLMQVRNDDGATYAADVRTGIIQFAELGFEPRTGDRIINGNETWVVRLQGSNAPWEYVGTTRAMVRVYLRRDDEEASAG